jgi:hypothetical protein
MPPGAKAMNAVARNLAQLKGRNYVLKANPKRGDYWHNWYFSKMQRKRKASGDDFYLMIYGSSEENDFFVIPFSAVKHALTEDCLAEGGKNDRPRRWIGEIQGKRLIIRHSGGDIDVSRYYGNHRLLKRAAERSGDDGYLRPEDGDTADEEGGEEQPYLPTSGDGRETVFRKIKARRGRQAFRDALRNRYGDLCLISGCRLMDIVEAAHIKPYRGEVDNHPGNGLLLRADLHTLFDLDMIGIKPRTLTVRVHPEAKEAGYGDFDGFKLQCSGAKPSAKAIALRWKFFRQRCKLWARSGRREHGDV